MTQASAADAPSPRSPLGLSLSQWWCVLGGVRATAERGNLALISAGVAFFGLMAIIPGVAAVVALFGLIGDPILINQQIEAMAGVAPDDVVAIIHGQVSSLLKQREDSLLAGGLFNLALSLWSALQGTRWVLMALTVVNRRSEQRTAFRRFITAALFTLYNIGLALIAVLLMGTAPVILAFLHLGAAEETLLLFLRWPILGGAAVAVAMILYSWGPRRKPPPWKWLWPGGVVAPILWVLASSALAFALREFPNFGAAYGSLASVVALLLWLYLTAFVFLLGGALNAELEFFAAGKPTTPMGKTEPTKLGAKPASPP